jgi:hypothetical protein
MATLEDVVRAFHAIGDAEERYRETLRQAIRDGVPQVDISRELKRTREMLRRDAMTDDEREALRRADAERKRARGTAEVTANVTITATGHRGPARPADG